MVERLGGKIEAGVAAAVLVAVVVLFAKYYEPAAPSQDSTATGRPAATKGVQ